MSDPTAAFLSVRFRLTDAEATTCASIAGGKCLKTIARERSIHPTTAKAQLHAVFRKTGTSKQIEVVAMAWRAWTA